MRVEQRPRILSLIAQCLMWPNHPEKGNNNNGTRAYLYECFQRQDLVEHLLQHDENENWGLTNRRERRHQTPRLDRDPSFNSCRCHLHASGLVQFASGRKHAARRFRLCILRTVVLRCNLKDAKAESDSTTHSPAAAACQGHAQLDHRTRLITQEHRHCCVTTGPFGPQLGSKSVVICFRGRRGRCGG